jgi:hypothetical protein
VIETAINGHADALATFNLKDVRQAGARFGCVHSGRVPWSGSQTYEGRENPASATHGPEGRGHAPSRDIRSSLNLFVATAIAARVGMTSEAPWYFSARGSRTTPARAKALPMRLGTANQPRDDDRFDTPDEPA